MAVTQGPGLAIRAGTWMAVTQGPGLVIRAGTWMAVTGPWVADKSQEIFLNLHPCFNSSTGTENVCIDIYLKIVCFLCDK